MLYERNASGALYWYPRTCPHTMEYSTSVGNTVLVQPYPLVPQRLLLL